MEARALQRLGSIAREQGRYEEARDFHSQSLGIWTELGDRRGIAASNNYLGFVAWLSGDQQSAESLCVAALAGFRQTQSLQDVAGTLVDLGASALYAGRLELAEERLEEALSIVRGLASRRASRGHCMSWRSSRCRRRRPPRQVARMLRDALLVHSQLGDRWRVASVLEEVAGSLLAQQDARLAVQLLAYAESLREQLQAPIPPVEAPTTRRPGRGWRPS